MNNLTEAQIQKVLDYVRKGDQIEVPAPEEEEEEEDTSQLSAASLIELKVKQIAKKQDEWVDSKHAMKLVGELSMEGVDDKDIEEVIRLVFALELKQAIESVRKSGHGR